MGDGRLRAVTRPSGANLALVSGAVEVEGASLEFEEVPVLVHAFRRMVRELAWDVCEMALTTYVCARAHGVAFTALPIFLVRGTHHEAIVRNRTSDVETPRDLERRQVGVGRGWTVTTGIWARGILADEHGVDLDAVTWLLSGDEHVADYQPPPNVVTGQAPDLAALLSSGAIPAAVNVKVDHPDVVPLLPDAHEAGLRAIADSAFWPINHLVVVRDDVLDAQPDLGARLFAAFAAAKQAYVDRLGADEVIDPTPADHLYREVLTITGADPLPYGIEPNRRMLECLVRYAVDQQVLDEAPSIESLFDPGTHDLVA